MFARIIGSPHCNETRDHEGEIVEITVRHCGHLKTVEPCKRCPGYITLPWTDSSECYGYDKKLAVQPIILIK